MMEDTNMEFDKSVGSSNATSNEMSVSLVKQDQQLAVQEAKNNLTSTRDRVKQALISSGEAKKLSDTLSVQNPQSIIEFGKQAAEQMSGCADSILRRQDSNQLTQSNAMMSALTKIMKKVDIKELSEIDDDPNFFERMFNSTQRKLEALTAKYNNVGNDIERVCVELRTYEAEIKKSNDDLDKLYANGVDSYQTLLKYVIAGECAIEEVENYLNMLSQRDQNDPDVQMETSNVIQAKQLLEQRVQDLRMAEAVALQSLPIIKAMQYGNLNLARKINSSFIVTIPVFKNAVAQALIARRQAIQAQALKKLDDKTNELLLQNAQNAANNMRMTAQLTGSSAIKMETIRDSWATIMQGITDTQAIQNELSKQRESDKVALEQINNQYLTQVTG